MLLSTPVAPYPELMDLFTPLAEQSEAVQELYEYHPDKAKQLLAEAGYPDGFKTEILCYGPQVEVASLIASYWADIGVELTLDVREFAVYNSIKGGRTHKQLIYSGLSSVAPFLYLHLYPNSYQNASMVDDPKVNAALAEAGKNIIINDAEAWRITRELYPYTLEQVWCLETPSPYLWIIWQPWVKGYGGEYTLGRSNPYSFSRYIWVDQDLKEEMTGRR